MEMAGLAAGAAAGKFMAGKFTDMAANEASERIGISSKFRTAKSFLIDEPDIPVNDTMANQFMRNIVKYMFYDNYIKDKTPSEAQLNIMLYLILITVDKGYFRFYLETNGIPYDVTKLISRDFSSFRDAAQKKKFIDLLINVDKDSDLRELVQGDIRLQGRFTPKAPDAAAAAAEVGEAGATVAEGAEGAEGAATEAEGFRTDRWTEEGITGRRRVGDASAERAEFSGSASMGSEGGGKKRKYKTKKISKNKRRTSKRKKRSNKSTKRRRR